MRTKGSLVRERKKLAETEKELEKHAIRIYIKLSERNALGTAGEPGRGVSVIDKNPTIKFN